MKKPMIESYLVQARRRSGWDVDATLAGARDAKRSEEKSGVEWKGYTSQWAVRLFLA